MFEPTKLLPSKIEKLCANIEKDPQLKNWKFTDFENSLNDEFHPIYIIDDFAFAAFAQIIDEAEILMIWVSPEMRHKGHGKNLLEFAFNALRKNNIKQVFLEVANNNSAAIALYKSLNFVQIGVRTKYYNNEIDALVYKLAY